MSRRIAIAVALLGASCAALAGAGSAGADTLCFVSSYDADAAQRYIEWVTSASLEELIATFGR